MLKGRGQACLRGAVRRRAIHLRSRFFRLRQLRQGWHFFFHEFVQRLSESRRLQLHAVLTILCRDACRRLFAFQGKTDRQSAAQTEECQATHRRQGAVPAHQLACTIGQRIRPRRHRESREIRTHIGRQCFHAGIPALRLFANCHQHNRIEFAAKQVRQRPSGAPHLVRNRGIPGDHATGRRRSLLNHSFCEVRQRHPLAHERHCAGEHFIQNDAQRVDISGSRHRPATQLLRAGIHPRSGNQPRYAWRFDVQRQILLKQARQAPVEDFRISLRGHADVVWLQVAMHQRHTMRGLYGRTNGPEEI